MNYYTLDELRALGCPNALLMQYIAFPKEVVDAMLTNDDYTEGFADGYAAGHAQSNQDIPALVETRINMFLERGIYESGAAVLCAAMDLLVEKQIAEESKTWGHTIESGCHPDCPDWEGPPKAGVSVKKEAHAYVNNCDFVGDGYWTGVSAYLAGYESALKAHRGKK